MPVYEELFGGGPRRPRLCGSDLDGPGPPDEVPGTGRAPGAAVGAGAGRVARGRGGRGGTGVARGTLPDDAFRELLRRLGVQATPHGFRSSFRDWCAEGGHPRELAEAALAHAVGDKVEAAYARTDLYERRRGVMEAWAGYLGSG